MDAVTDLQIRMDKAAAALDFEEARRLRDLIALVRGGATLDEAMAADTAQLKRQQPGAMGLGTSRQKPIAPPGWKPPLKPDPMTRNRSKRR
ncbi:MAG: UvrB/UvrC motif-containing protein [Pseudomonadota bacterium]|nr:UvrB/UvrC motif-containing protein [Pseudomonadota bacterium]